MSAAAAASLLALLPAVAGQALDAFEYYGSRQTSLESKHWRREHWNRQLLELSDVVYDVPENDWFRSHKSRTTLAHETCHAIDNDLSSRGGRPCRGWQETGFYLTGNRAACVSKPTAFNKDDVKPFVPKALRWGRYNLYMERINKGGDPLLVHGEWTCYIVDAETAAELFEEELLMRQGNLRNLKDGAEEETRVVDHGLGAVEFLTYSYAVGLAAEALEPSYLPSPEGQQFLALTKEFTERTFLSYCRLRPYMKPHGPYPAWNFTKGYQQFTDSDAARPIRDFGERHYGADWFGTLMHCGVKTPAPATPVPVPGVAHLTLRADNGRVERGAVSGTIEDGYGQYPDSADRAVTVEGEGACRVRWVSFDVEDEPSCAFDAVEVTADGELLGRFCGSERPPQIVVPGGRFTVRLVSDGSVQHSGFELAYACGIDAATPAPVVVTPSPATPPPATAVPRTAAPATPAPQTAECKDEQDWCPQYERLCTHANVRTWCAKTCGVCTDAVPVPPVPATGAPSTSAPPTAAPSTSAPATAAPSTSAPATAAPSTSVPATAAPSTSVPETPEPTVAVDCEDDEAWCPEYAHLCTFPSVQGWCRKTCGQC